MKTYRLAQQDIEAREVDVITGRRQDGAGLHLRIDVSRRSA